jgi:hypothetical protein
MDGSSISALSSSGARKSLDAARFFRVAICPKLGSRPRPCLYPSPAALAGSGKDEYRAVQGRMFLGEPDLRV